MYLSTRWIILVYGSPSCLQVTSASGICHESMHTLPQTLLMQISTRPWLGILPCSLMSPWVQLVAEHVTPTSLEWPQLVNPSWLAGQSMSLDSFPSHWTSSSQITPEPLGRPKVRVVAAKQWSNKILVLMLKTREAFIEHTPRSVDYQHEPMMPTSHMRSHDTVSTKPHA